MKYLFGDTDLATQRLGALDEAFSPTSERFVRGAAGDAPGLAIDLGCGPGHTTHMLARAAGGQRTVGLDHSEHFVELAEQSRTEGVSFARHDITEMPLPVGPADLMYCRFLLTHMNEPTRLLADWATQLRPGGRLLAEEIESVRTRNSVFAFYVDTVAAMLKAQGQQLYIGRALHLLTEPEGLHRRKSEVARVALTRPQAARLFHMNIQIWRHTEFIQTHYPSDMIDELVRDLAALTRANTERTDIVWTMRQIVYERK